MTEGCINQFQSYLRNEEKAEATISKYLHDVKEMLEFIGKMDLNKEVSKQSIQATDCKWKTFSNQHIFKI